MVYKLFSISVNWLDRRPAVHEVDETLSNLEGDWIRFSPSQWYLFTDLDLPTVARTVRPVVSTECYCVITAIESIAAQGCAPEWLWTWLNSKMLNLLGFTSPESES